MNGDSQLTLPVGNKSDHIRADTYIDAQTVFKFCSCCRELKPLSSFPTYNHPHAHSGHFWQCRACLAKWKRDKRAAKRAAKQQADNDPSGWDSAKKARELNSAWPPLRR